jgi:superfamily I DNA/RNA helicase
VFTHALKDLIATGFEDLARRVPVKTYHQFLSRQERYDLVIIDEVQDIPTEKLNAIKQLAGRVVIAGDTDQSIYDNCSTADQIESILQPRPHLLTVTHRLTKKIMDLARTILPTSQLETVSTARMQEVQVTLAEADTEQEEIEWVWSQSRRDAEPGDPAAVLLPSHRIVQEFISQVCQVEGTEPPDFPPKERFGGTDYGPANEWLAEAGIPLRYLGNAYGDLRESDEQALTYVMTYHSAKGLDFETVFLPFLNDGQSFWWKDKEIDRRLFFVGVTRSRRNLFLSYSGARPHEYVRGMPQELLHRSSCEVRKDAEDDQDFFF